MDKNNNPTDFTTPEWYLVCEGSQDPLGPFSMRDLDVKFRTGEITTSVMAWREGMSEWSLIF